MNKVYIIGIGPGTEEYLPPIAKEEIEKADCLIGSKRVLSLFQHLNKEILYLEGDLDIAIHYVKENRNKKRISVLVSGDPGLYSLLRKIRQILKRDEYIVIPGISTMQLAFARIGDVWQDAKIISIHGRGLVGLEKDVKTSDKIFLFMDPAFPPNEIARYLLEKGVENRRVIVFENIAYRNEKMTDTDLKNLSKMKGFGLCVMLIKKE